MKSATFALPEIVDVLLPLSGGTLYVALPYGATLGFFNVEVESEILAGPVFCHVRSGSGGVSTCTVEPKSVKVVGGHVFSNFTVRKVTNGTKLIVAITASLPGIDPVIVAGMKTLHVPEEPDEVAKPKAESSHAGPERMPGLSISFPPDRARLCAARFKCEGSADPSTEITALIIEIDGAGNEIGPEIGATEVNQPGTSNAWSARFEDVSPNSKYRLKVRDGARERQRDDLDINTSHCG